MAQNKWMKKLLPLRAERWRSSSVRTFILPDWSPLDDPNLANRSKGGQGLVSMTMMMSIACEDIVILPMLVNSKSLVTNLTFYAWAQVAHLGFLRTGKLPWIWSSFVSDQGHTGLCFKPGRPNNQTTPSANQKTDHPSKQSTALLNHTSSADLHSTR